MIGKSVNDSEPSSEERSITQSGDLPLQAEIALLDRCYFALPEDAFKRFNAILDGPVVINPLLERLLKNKIWS